MRKTLGAWLVVGALLAPLPWQVATADPTEQQLAQLRSEMAKLQAQLDQELAARDELLAQLAQTQKALGRTQNAIDAAANEQTQLQQQLETLRKRQSELDAQARQGLVTLTDLLIRGYPLANNSGLKALFNQTDPARAARLLAYHRLLSQHTAKQLTQIENNIAAAQAAQANINASLDRLDELKAEQSQRLARLETLDQQRQADLEALSTRIQSDADQLDSLREDEQRLAEVLRTAEAAAPDPQLDEDRPPVTALKGALPMPVVGEIIKRFGQRRQNDARWRGWLIATDEPAPVHAVAPGRVVYADWLRGYGLLLIVDHQDELLSLYAHNERLFYEVGDWVRMGARIGMASRPGRDPLPNGAGMYFELRHRGQPTDPGEWLDIQRSPAEP